MENQVTMSATYILIALGFIAAFFFAAGWYLREIIHNATQDTAKVHFGPPEPPSDTDTGSVISDKK